MNALANPEVGKFINEYFVSAFQKVGTFRIVGGAKQGGNVASYFCAPDGRVLHVVAGPVNAPTLLREAKWVVDEVKKSLAEHEKSGKSFKVQFRKAHAERLRKEHGLTVDVATFDAPAPGENNALSYRDPTGKPLAPVLPLPPIDGPDVSFTPQQQQEFAARNAKACKAPGACIIADRVGRRWAVGNQGQVHMLMAGHSMKKIESVYGTIFEGILGRESKHQTGASHNSVPLGAARPASAARAIARPENPLARRHNQVAHFLESVRRRRILRASTDSEVRRAEGCDKPLVPRALCLY